MKKREREKLMQTGGIKKKKEKYETKELEGEREEKKGRSENQRRMGRRKYEGCERRKKKR